MDQTRWHSWWLALKVCLELNGGIDKCQLYFFGAQNLLGRALAFFWLYFVECSLWYEGKACCLSTETVEGTALALESVDNIHGGDSLAASVLGVGHGVTDDVLEEDLEDTAGLLVDEAADALDTTTAREAADGGLGDTLDVVAKDLAVALGAALSESLTSLSTSRHVVRVLVFVFVTRATARLGFL